MGSIIFGLFFVVFIVAVVQGIIKGGNRELKIFQDKKDLMIATGCTFSMFVLYLVAPFVLIPSIVRSCRYGQNGWDRVCIFSARFILSFCGAILVTTIFNSASNKNSSVMGQALSTAFWGVVTYGFYRWVLKFVWENEEVVLKTFIGDIKV